MWTVPAADLLALDEVGVIPWVPLARYAEPAEVILRKCRQAIDRLAPEGHHGNLLAVSQVLTRLRYDDRKLLQIIGGRQAMIEAPLIQELLQEGRVEGLRTLLLQIDTRLAGLTDIRKRGWFSE